MYAYIYVDCYRLLAALFRICINDLNFNDGRRRGIKTIQTACRLTHIFRLTVKYLSANTVHARKLDFKCFQIVFHFSFSLHNKYGH